MSLTRKMLKAMGIEDEKIDQIIEAHTETVDALKEQRDGYKPMPISCRTFRKSWMKPRKSLKQTARIATR